MTATPRLSPLQSLSTVRVTVSGCESGSRCTSLRVAYAQGEISPTDQERSGGACIDPRLLRHGGLRTWGPPFGMSEQVCIPEGRANNVRC